MPTSRQQSSLLGGEKIADTIIDNNSVYICKVIDTFPERNMIDVLMLSGGVVRNVQVVSSGASSKSGVVDLPKVSYHPEDAEFIPDNTISPVDASGNTGTTGKRPRITTSGREVADGFNAYAIVCFVDGVIYNPICIGFLYPETSEMLFYEAQFLQRHESDIYELIDKDGNYDHVFPDGTFIRIGEGTTRTDLVNKNTNRNWTTKADDVATQEDAKTVHIEHKTGTTVTINPDGSVNVNVVADKVTTITGAKTETVTGANTLTNEDTYDVTTIGNKTETIGETLNTTITGEVTETAESNSTENVTGTKTFTGSIMDIQNTTVRLLASFYTLTGTTFDATLTETFSLTALDISLIAPIINVTGSQVGLGPAATFGVPLGEILNAWLATHVHIGGVGVPTTPPPLPSTTVKVSL